MCSVDTASSKQAVSTERKPWETPVVIVASTQRETLSALNTVGVDGTYGGSSYGS